MTTATEITETVQDAVLKAIETGQRLTLEAFAAASSTFEGVMPERAATPFATTLVSPQETIDASFRFAERLLNSQKTFLSELAAITIPGDATQEKK